MQTKFNIEPSFLRLKISSYGNVNIYPQKQLGAITIDSENHDIEISKSENTVSIANYSNRAVNIYCPQINLSLQLSGSGKFKSQQVLSSVLAELSDSTSAEFSANKAHLRMSGTSTAEVNLIGQPNDFYAYLTEGANAEITGNMASASIEAMGQSTLSTHGICFGDYSVTASGVSNIRHTGEIKGIVDEECGALAFIEIND
jgi:hypothetical protein